MVGVGAFHKAQATQIVFWCPVVRTPGPRKDGDGGNRNCLRSQAATGPFSRCLPETKGNKQHILWRHLPASFPTTMVLGPRALARTGRVVIGTVFDPRPGQARLSDACPRPQVTNIIFVGGIFRHRSQIPRPQYTGHIAILAQAILDRV